MGRPKLLDVRRKLTLEGIPETLLARLDLILLNPTTGKVPRGAYSRFFAERTEEYLAKLAAAQPQSPQD